MSRGWQTRRLGDLAELITKGTTPTSIGHAFVSAGVTFVKVESLSQGGEFIASRLAYITEECHATLRRSQLKAGDILFSIAGALGRTAMVTEDILPANTNQALALIRLRRSQDVLPEFVLKALATGLVLEQVEKSRGGVAQQNLSLAQVQAMTIPIPPPADQSRIVAILDEAFEGIATAKANAQKNMQSARALFEGHLQSVFTQRGPGWVETNLGDLCEVFADGDWVESKDQSSEGIRLIQTGNVGEGVFKDRADKARYISEATFKRLRCTEIFEGDCLISRLPDPVGRSCILPDTGERMITAVDCTIVRFDQKRLLPKFFNHYSQSDGYIRTVAKECTGTTRNRISRSNLALTPIPIPPIAEQKRLVTEFDNMREETQRLARLYERKCAALEALKKSLLHQAFTGAL